MIYLVSSQQELFNSSIYQSLSVEESISIIEKWKHIQFDTETKGRDPHIGTLLTAQFGSPDKSVQIVVDCTTSDITQYKHVLESKTLLGHNLKFDLQWLYNYKIIPLKVLDTMVIEQTMYLGYTYTPISYEKYEEFEYDFPYHLNGDYVTLSFALDAVAKKYLDIELDKSVRGEIIWRGIDDRTIQYAANDVVYLTDIATKQIEIAKQNGYVAAIKLECDFVPAIAYLEWCGIKLDETKWKAKMQKDQEALEVYSKKLNDFLVKKSEEVPLFKQFIHIDTQGDLFDGFNLEPQVTINWSSSKQVILIAKALGFNVSTQDKKTGDDKESVMEKQLGTQIGICDEFLDLYFKYQEAAKVTSSFGQGHLNAINPITGRLHTTYKQLGAASGRMSCGSTQPNEDLAAFKKISPKECTYPNIQQLPHDETTRSCFVSEPGNLFLSCDYSAQEGRVQGDIYNDEAILKMYREGIDGHSMYAKVFFPEELKDIDVHDVKKLRPDLRTKAKSPEFALSYGGSYLTIKQQLKCSDEEAKQIIKNYEAGFEGTTRFAKAMSKFVRENGYIPICRKTGHRMHWWDWREWSKRQNKPVGFLEEYKIMKVVDPDAPEIKIVKTDYKAASKYDRLARNAPPQGTSACISKRATTLIFHEIVSQDLFGVILFVAMVHDELNFEFPKDLEWFPAYVAQTMKESGAYFCNKIEIPAEPSVGDHWIH